MKCDACAFEPLLIFVAICIARISLASLLGASLASAPTKPWDGLIQALRNGPQAGIGFRRPDELSHRPCAEGCIPYGFCSLRVCAFSRFYGPRFPSCQLARSSYNSVRLGPVVLALPTCSRH